MQPRSNRTSLAAVVVLALATALTFVTVSGAGATPPNLSTDDAINTYLTSIGVTDAVWQGTTANPSHKNYAGPGCPGSSWNCVPATTPIVQITDAGGYNVFACGGLDCVVVQVALHGGQNGGACVRSDKSNDQTQVCDITQTNAGNPNSTNAAAIAQNIQQSSSFSQNARQVARITQGNTLGKNIATVHQVVGQTQNTKGGAGVTQTQEAHQAATVDQLTSLPLGDPFATAGGNSSNVTQRQDQSQKASKVGPVLTQRQNTTLGTDFDLLHCDDPDDLAFDQDKNQCADVDQVSDPVSGGTLDASLRQLSNQSQNASASPSVSQSQGTGVLTGGQNGTVDHLSSGLATNVADVDMSQSQTATGTTTLSQTKFTGDPRCCQTQGTNPGDTSEIDLSTNQFASAPTAFQDATLSSHCVTSGNCDVMLSSTINGETETEPCTGSVCEETLSCTDAEGETVCSTTEPTPTTTTTTTETFTGPD